MFAYNEHNFILGNLEVVNEFDTKSFQANASSYIKGDINSINFKTSFYSKSIASAIDGLKDITLDKEAVREFAKLNFTNETLLPIRPIDYSDVTSISPDYLTTYSSRVKSYTDSVVKNNDSTIRREEADQVIFDTYKLAKKNIVKTTLDYRLPLNMLVSSTDKVKKIIPDSKYITSTILPFVNGFEKTRANLSNEGKELLVAVTTAESDIETTIGIVDNFAKVTNDPGKYMSKVKYVEYNGIYNIISLMSYVSYMYIRKVNEFRENVLNCNRLYTDLANLNNANVSESSEIGINPGVISTAPANLGFSLMQGNVAAYEVLANKVYELYTGKNRVRDIDDVLRLGDDVPDHIDGQYTQGQVRYNRDVYDNMKKVFIGIGQGLYDICQIPDGLMIKKKSLVDKDIMNEEDIISNAGFRIPLKDKFRAPLESILDISKIQYADFVSIHGVDAATVDELLSEVRDFGHNMQEIANEVIDAYAILREIEKRFDYNINNEFKDVDAVKEIEEWSKLFDDEFVAFVNDMCARFMERLAHLAIVLKHINDDLESPNRNTEDVVTKAFNLLDVRDYTSGITEDACDYEIFLNHEKFEALEKAYQILKVKKDTGCDLVFEADNPTNANTTQGINNPNDKQNDKAGFLGKISASGGNAVENLKGKITNWFKNLMDTFKANTDKLKNDETVVKVNNASNDIANGVDYNNIPPFQQLPYENISPDTVLDKLNNTLGGYISQMNPQVIQQINTKEELYQKLFSFIPGFKPSGDLKTQFTNFNKTGNAEAAAIKQYQGAELKDQVTNNMIPYVRNYTNNFANTVSAAVDGVMGKLNTAVEQYKTVSGNKPVNGSIQTTTTQVKAESALFEADNPNQNNPNQPNKNTQASMEQKAEWMASAVELYCGSVTNALRDRFNDYLTKCLSPLSNVNTGANQNVNPQQ